MTAREVADSVRLMHPDGIGPEGQVSVSHDPSLILHDWLFALSATVCVSTGGARVQLYATEAQCRELSALLAAAAAGIKEAREAFALGGGL